MQRITEGVAYSRPLFAEWFGGQPTYRKFVIICGIRTGSTMLVNLLNSHPEIRCFFEIFHRYQASIPFHIPGYNRRSKHSGLIKMHVENPAVFAKRYIYGKHLSHIRAVGFKLL